MLSLAIGKPAARVSAGLSSFFRCMVVGALGLVAGLHAPSLAANPRDDLLGLVPDDAAFCFIVNDLRGHTQKLGDAPWVKAIEKSPFAKDFLNTPEARQLRAIKERVLKRLEISIERLRDDILGDAIVFAYRLGPPGKPAQDRGVVMLWARDAALLAKVVAFVNADLKETQALVHKQMKYFRRIESKGDAGYYFIDGSLLAFSAQEEMIRQVIDRSLERKGGDKGRSPGFLVEQLYRLGADKALAVVLLNPRAFDAHIRASLASSRSAGHLFFQSFVRYWEALEGIALTVSMEPEIEVKLAVKADPDKLPPALGRFFSEASKPSELWARFPPNALVAMAGRLDMVAFATLLGDFLPKNARRDATAQINQTLKATLGLDLTQDILPNLGPDIGFCITAPPDAIIVPQVTGAIRIHPGPEKKRVDRAVFNGLSSLAFLAVLSNAGNKSGSMRLRSARQDGVEVKYLESDKLFPAGVKPALALKEGYLLLATSPDAVLGFHKRQAVEAKSDEVLLLRVSLKEWSAFVKARRDALAAYLIGMNGLTMENARRQVGNLAWGLALFDRVELTQRTGAGMAVWTLRVKPLEVAKKN